MTTEHGFPREDHDGLRIEVDADIGPNKVIGGAVEVAQDFDVPLHIHLTPSHFEKWKRHNNLGFRI